MPGTRFLSLCPISKGKILIEALDEEIIKEITYLHRPITKPELIKIYSKWSESALFRLNNWVTIYEFFEKQGNALSRSN
jgi:hypothetical protein